MTNHIIINNIVTSINSLSLLSWCSLLKRITYYRYLSSYRLHCIWRASKVFINERHNVTLVSTNYHCVHNYALCNIVNMHSLGLHMAATQYNSYITV